jgi:hypothetical protein
MKRVVDYGRSPTPAFDAVEDVKKELGLKRWNVVQPMMAKIVDPEQFALWADFAGISGFPVQAWYELYHGGGSWEKAWHDKQRSQYEAGAKRPINVIISGKAQKTGVE